MVKEKLSGIITPMVTPLNRDYAQTINYIATSELIEHLISNGVSGIFILGSNGEFHVLSYEEKCKFIKYVVEKVNFRIPVFVGVGDCNFNEVIDLAKYSKLVGADALSLVPPYFIKPTDDEILEYFKKVSEISNLPIIVYNIPKNTGYTINKDLLDELFKIENIVGIKDSSGDENLLLQYLDISKKYNKSVLVGSDSKISFGYKNGASGAIAGTSNLITKLLVDLWDCLERDDIKAIKLQKDIDVLRECLKFNTVPSVLKRSMELANICETGPARLPVKDIKEMYDDKLIEMLRFYNL